MSVWIGSQFVTVPRSMLSGEYSSEPMRALPRNKPVIVLRGKARIGSLEYSPDSIDLGTVTNCEPIHTLIHLHNPYAWTAEVIDAAITGDTEGFHFENI